MQSVRPYPLAPVCFGFLRPLSDARPLVARHLRARSIGALLSVALALVVGFGCAAGKPAEKRAAGGDVSYTSFSSNTKLRMVSDGWVEAQGYEGVDAAERRADFYRKNVYTQGGGTAAVKVCDDPIFEGIVQALDAAGFSQYATQGSAPVSGAGASQFLELSVDGQVRHFARTKGLPAEALKAFQSCLTVFGEVFNVVEGYQSGDGSFQFNSKPARAGG